MKKFILILFLFSLFGCTSFNDKEGITDEEISETIQNLDNVSSNSLTLLPMYQELYTSIVLSNKKIIIKEADFLIVWDKYFNFYLTILIADFSLDALTQTYEYNEKNYDKVMNDISSSVTKTNAEFKYICIIEKNKDIDNCILNKMHLNMEKIVYIEAIEIVFNRKPIEESFKLINDIGKEAYKHHGK